MRLLPRSNVARSGAELSTSAWLTSERWSSALRDEQHFRSARTDSRLVTLSGRVASMPGTGPIGVIAGAALAAMVARERRGGAVHQRAAGAGACSWGAQCVPPPSPATRRGVFCDREREARAGVVAPRR